MNVSGLGAAFQLVAVILFVLAALPPVPYTNSLLALGLAFHAAGHLA